MSSNFKVEQDPRVNWEFLNYTYLDSQNVMPIKKQRRERENAFF